MKPQLLTTPQAAEFLGGIKTNTLEIWRGQGRGVPYIKIGRLVRYKVEDLEKYLADQTRSSTSQQVTA